MARMSRTRHGTSSTSTSVPWPSSSGEHEEIRYGDGRPVRGDRIQPHLHPPFHPKTEPTSSSHKRHRPPPPLLHSDTCENTLHSITIGPAATSKVRPAWAKRCRMFPISIHRRIRQPTGSPLAPRYGGTSASPALTNIVSSGPRTARSAGLAVLTPAYTFFNDIFPTLSPLSRFSPASINNQLCRSFFQQDPRLHCHLMQRRREDSRASLAS